MFNFSCNSYVTKGKTPKRGRKVQIFSLTKYKKPKKVSGTQSLVACSASSSSESESTTEARISSLDVSQNNASSSIPLHEGCKEIQAVNQDSVEINDQEILEDQIPESEISKPVNLIDNSNIIKDEADLIRQRSFIEGSTVSIKDIVCDTPTFLEAIQHISLRNRCISTKLRAPHYYNPDNSIKNEFKSLWNITVDLYRTIVLYGYTIPISKLRTQMINTWLQFSVLTYELPEVKEIDEFRIPISRWMKVIKYCLAAFAAWAKDSDIFPKSPLLSPYRPEYLINKEFKFWLLSHKREDLNSRIWYMSLIDTLCRGVKKGADRSLKGDCDVNCIETFKLFTTEKDKPEYKYKIPGSCETGTLTQQDIENEIERSVIEIIGFSVFEPKFNLCPSFSSATDNGLRTGGHVKVVKQHIKSYPHTKTIEVKHGMLKEPFPLNHFNNTSDEDPYCNKKIDSTDESSFEAIRKYGEMKSVAYIQVDQNSLNNGTDLDIEELCEVCLSRPSEIKAIGLKEALKVRGITTPDALESWLLKPLQKFLAKQLLKHKVFAVTGTPLTEQHLESVFKELLDGETLVSGDYDNATNMMINSYTRKCVESICNHLGLSELYSKVAIRSLCDNIVKFNYKEGNCNKEYHGVQKEAQPMGKILSFTVLCIINFSVCRKALELDQNRFIPIKNFPGLINGDDCCFPIRCFEHWVGVSAMVGLFNSIGKTFTSRNFIEMNSRSFLVTNLGKYDTYNLKFKEVPFINFGLMKGLVRSAGEDVEERSKTVELRNVVEACSRMGWCHQELIRGFEPWHHELDYLFRFYHNKYLLSSDLSGVPYYIPQWLGGLGLHPSNKPHELITDQQRRQARYIYQNLNKLRVESMCLSKTCLIDKIINDELSSMCKDFGINKEIPPFQILETLEEYQFGPDQESVCQKLNLKEENQKVYSLRVEDIWRSKPLEGFFNSIDDDFIEIQNHIASRKLENNRKIWLKCQWVNCKPLKWYKMWHQKQNVVLPVVMKNHENSWVID